MFSISLRHFWWTVEPPFCVQSKRTIRVLGECVFFWSPPQGLHLNTWWRWLSRKGSPELWLRFWSVFYFYSEDNTREQHLSSSRTNQQKQAGITKQQFLPLEWSNADVWMLGLRFYWETFTAGRSHSTHSISAFHEQKTIATEWCPKFQKSQENPRMGRAQTLGRVGTFVQSCMTLCYFVRIRTRDPSHRPAYVKRTRHGKHVKHSPPPPPHREQLLQEIAGIWREEEIIWGFVRKVLQDIVLGGEKQGHV